MELRFSSVFQLFAAVTSWKFIDELLFKHKEPESNNFFFLFNSFVEVSTVFYAFSAEGEFFIFTRFFTRKCRSRGAFWSWVTMHRTLLRRARVHLARELNALSDETMKKKTTRNKILSILRVLHRHALVLFSILSVCYTVLCVSVTPQLNDVSPLCELQIEFSYTSPFERERAKQMCKSLAKKNFSTRARQSPAHGTNTKCIRSFYCETKLSTTSSTLTMVPTTSKLKTPTKEWSRMGRTG